MDEQLLNRERSIESLVGIKAYSTPEIKGINGIYKHSFRDFIVKEITNEGITLEIREDPEMQEAYSEEQHDNYTTFSLIKVNKDTFEAIRELSDHLHLPLSSINYSGLKDKCSISVQKVSVRGNHVEKLKKIKIRDSFFRNIRPSKKPVKLGDNWGNHFIIIIRNIENVKDCKRQIENIFETLKKNGFPNYFGLQRFGIYRPNSHLIGRDLLEGNYKKAFEEFVTEIYDTEAENLQKIRNLLKTNMSLEEIYSLFPNSLHYEKSMIHHLIQCPEDYMGCFNTLPNDLKNLLISAFQSYLFNRMLSLRVEKGISLFKPIKGDVICILEEENGNITQTKYIYGANNGIYDKYLVKALNLNRAAIVVPIIGYNSNLNNFPLMKSLLEEILQQDNIDTRIFQNQLLVELDFKGSIRAMMIKPIGLKILEFAEDEIFPGKMKIKIEFSLVKGAYATMLLRELIK